MGTCTALSLHDSSKCPEPATNVNGQFCQFHARQVQGLYEGYKRRSQELEVLEKNAPKCLPKNLGNTDFAGVKDLEQLKEIYAYLLKKFNLVTRCVVARDFHHSHFYADKSDYGHQSFLERLRSSRALLTTILHRLEKRTLDVKYSKTQWYNWVESFQAEADAKSEVEKKKVKAEAALFKAHQENVSRLREEEEAKRRAEAEKEEIWDPIEQIIGDTRAGYVALIRVLINAEGVEEKEMQMAIERAKEINASAGELGARRTESRADKLLLQRQRQLEARMEDSPGQGPRTFQHVQTHQEGVMEELERRNRKEYGIMGSQKEKEEEPKEEQGKKENTKKKTKKKGKKSRGNGKLMTAMVESEPEVKEVEGKDDGPLDLEDMIDDDMKALIESVIEFTHANQPALYLNFDSGDGSAKIRAEVRTIYEYLVLRSIIASPSLLSAAILSPSIDAFLNDTIHVRNTDLRDLALELSRPSDESIRNACADYWAAAKMNDLENPEDDEPSSQLTVHQPKPKGNKKGKKKRSGKGKKPTTQTQQSGGKADRVKVCGRWIYNYPAETKMPRRGWFQFAILTGASFPTAASLCKSWQEFYELNILSLNGYFQGIKNGWDCAREPPPIGHLRRIGFVSYSLSYNSANASGFTQSTRHNRGAGRSHAATEARNYIAANMCRDDPRVQRFIEIVQTHVAELVVYIRDCKTGQVIVEPPEEERWIIRDKMGAGRLHRGKWTVRQSFDKAFKANLDRERLWKPFKDCIDVVIWDRLPARPPEQLQYTLIKLLHKAFKFTDHISAMESTLELYYQMAKEEEGADGPIAAKAREIKKSIREYRRKLDEEGKKETPIKRSEHLYYDSVDEDVDKDHPYDTFTTWDLDSGVKDDADVKELVELHKNATDEEEVKRLEQVIVDIMMEKMVAKNKREKEFTIDDDLGDDEEDWEDESEDLDDEDDDGEYIGIWERAEDEAFELYDEAEIFSKAIFEQQLERFPEKEKHYREQRKFLNEVGRRQNNMNSKTRQKLEKRQQEIMTGTPFIPQNFIRCQFIIEHLWGESPELPNDQLIEYQETFEALYDKVGRAKFPPMRRPPTAPQYALEEWDKLRPKKGDSMDDYDIPREWEHAIQKNITRLWKNDLIQPSWAMSCVPVFVGRESPDKPLYLYSDYRGLVTTGRLLSPTTDDPYMEIPQGPRYLREEMEKYEKEHPGATYSLLRVASEPDCWPFDMSEEDALYTAILDREGRIWEWIKTPKDMPWSDYIMHDYVRSLLTDPPSLDPKSETDSITSSVRHRVDTILIMGDMESCRQWSTLCLGYVRKLPYSFEINLARSFLRVDAEFLRGLQECWWE